MSQRATHEVEPIEGGVRLRIAGEIDLAVADDLQRWIIDAIMANSGSDVEIDLSEVTFLESTGIRALVLARRKALDHRSSMRVVKPSSRVEMVLRITGVFDLLSGNRDLS